MAKQDNISRWIAVIVIVFLLGFMSFFFSLIIGLFVSDNAIGIGNVAVIPVQGIIQTGEIGLPFSGEVASSDRIIKDIKKAQDDPQIKAIIFDINSPGGYPVPSHEIVKAVKKVNKTTVAVVRDIGASGAYWIASASDHIVADSFSLVGSIGVTSAFLTFGGFLEDHNITYQRIVSAEMKDIGTPYKDLTPEETAVLQSITDTAHEMFVKDVAGNRNIPYSKMDDLANGQVYLGVDALRKGLIDRLGGMEESIEYLEETLNITVDTIIYSHKESFLESLSSISGDQAYSIGYGIGKAMISQDSGSQLSMT